MKTLLDPNTKNGTLVAAADTSSKLDAAKSDVRNYLNPVIIKMDTMIVTMKALVKVYKEQESLPICIQWQLQSN